ncbi:LysE/ArgO family amino acid transporter [Weissella soli]|uniref:LysE/ArgO family amino acid transporter n=1 Tax=Weissella soli TaxID=155866 RepID=UPI0011BB76E0|nr:LysE family transporter [Weissella soli]QEA34746.1 amino acid transporter [Weissella soli]
MLLQVILQGMLIGFAYSAPIGMQNLYIFNNALSNRLSKAFLYASVIWLVDAVFSLIAFLGVGTLIMQNDFIKLAVMLIGGLIVSYLGGTIIRTANAVQLNTIEQATTLGKVFVTALVLSFGNPQALIDGSLMLGALRGTLADREVMPFYGGVILATAIWFTGITLAFNILRDRLSKRFLVWINLISGFIVLLYGLRLILEFIKHFF